MELRLYLYKFTSLKDIEMRKADLTQRRHAGPYLYNLVSKDFVAIIVFVLNRSTSMFHIRFSSCFILESINQHYCGFCWLLFVTKETLNLKIKGLPFLLLDESLVLMEYNKAWQMYVITSIYKKQNCKPKKNII